MIIDKILKELDENKVQEIELAPTSPSDTPVRVSVDLVTRKKIIQDFLEGKEKKDIARSYGIPTRSVSLIVEKNSDIRLETEKKYQATALARENYRLSETKNKLLTFVDSTLDEIMSDPGSMTPESKMRVLKDIASLFDKLSLASRLNNEKPSHIIEERRLDLKMDLAEILKQLPTTEDKLAFLKRQSTHSKLNESIYEGEIVPDTE